jgi:hypothetical protein
MGPDRLPGFGGNTSKDRHATPFALFGQTSPQNVLCWFKKAMYSSNSLRVESLDAPAPSTHLISVLMSWMMVLPLIA